MSRPFVSCVCPTHDRRKFLPQLFHMFAYQTYPADRLELVILDDSPTSNQDLVDALPRDLRERIKYTYLQQGETRMPLGKKRNMLNGMAKGDIIVALDDDDYYPPEKVAYTVTRMLATKAQMSGSSELYVYYSDQKKIYRFGPYNASHATNGTFAYTRSYLASHSYQDEATSAEERHFLSDYTVPVLQLNPYKTILCIAHGKNTFDKNKVRPNGKPTALKLAAFVKDKHLLAFYKML